MVLVPITTGNDGKSAGSAYRATIAVAPASLADGSTSLEVMGR